MKLKIACLFADHLDLNGDQANMKVAVKRLEWCGHQGTISSVEKGESIPSDTDLIFLGHGSLAAWADIDAHFNTLLPQIKQMIASGVAFMAVASGYERAIELGIFPGDLNQTSRVSKFEIVEASGNEVLGYLNAATDAPIIHRNGLLLGTQLHGPFFAKNPDYADRYLSEVLVSRSKSAPADKPSLDSVMSPVSSLKHNVDRVADIVRAVWSLEKDLASE